MRKCTGNNTQEWGPDAIFDVKCKNCGNLVEFFKDEITRNCSRCKNTVYNDRKDYGLRIRRALKRPDLCSDMRPINLGGQREKINL